MGTKKLLYGTPIVLTALGAFFLLMWLTFSGDSSLIESMKKTVRCHARCGGPETTLTCGEFDEDSEHPGIEYSVCVVGDTGDAGMDAALILDEKHYGGAMKVEVFVMPTTPKDRVKKKKKRRKPRIKKRVSSETYL